MTKEQVEINKENKEQTNEIQRIEIDTDKGAEVVIKQTPEEEFMSPTGRYQSVKIIIKKNGKTVEDLQEKLSGLKFFRRKEFFKKKDQERWSYSNDCKEVLMPKYWEDGKDALKLFHEIGHGLYHSKHLQEIEEKRKLLKEMLKVFSNLNTIAERGTIEYRQGVGDPGEERPAIKADQKRLVEQLRKLYPRYNELLAKSERGAWAEGLNLIRSLKREKKIDLLKPFKGKTSKETRENLEKFIHGDTALGSYEQELRNKIKKFNLSPRLKTSFTKQYKQKTKETSKQISERASNI